MINPTNVLINKWNESLLPNTRIILTYGTRKFLIFLISFSNIDSAFYERQESFISHIYTYYIPDRLFNKTFAFFIITYVLMINVDNFFGPYINNNIIKPISIFIY
jgi:hypothetical protein